MDEKKIKQAVRGLYSYNRLKRNKHRVDLIDNALNSLSASDRELIFRFYINHKRRAVWCRHGITSCRSSIYDRANEALKRYIAAYCRKE